jgi:hypothetical protein
MPTANVSLDMLDIQLKVVTAVFNIANVREQQCTGNEVIIQYSRRVPLWASFHVVLTQCKMTAIPMATVLWNGKTQLRTRTACYVQMEVKEGYVPSVSATMKTVDFGKTIHVCDVKMQK